LCIFFEERENKTTTIITRTTATDRHVKVFPLLWPFPSAMDYGLNKLEFALFKQAFIQSPAFLTQWFL
jgi:hypothetical protein